jgi:hypothetical protein
MALHQGVWPLPTAEEMNERFSVIAARHPEHREICDHVIVTRPALRAEGPAETG